MSKSDRKVNYYFLGINKDIDEEQKANVFSLDLIKRFCEFSNSLPSENKLLDIKQSEKAVVLGKIEIYGKQQKTFLKGIAYSGKYNHSPNCFSRNTGKERKTNKGPDEAYEERTHFLGEVESDGINLLFESRQSGASIGMVVQCLNKILKGFASEKGIYFHYDSIAVDNIEETLKSMRRISLGNIYIDKKYIGSKEMNLAHGEGYAAIQDDVIVMLKAQKYKTISQSDVRKWIKSAAATESKISRVRIEGKDAKSHVIIDTLFTKKCDIMNVELDSQGLVDSHSIFSKFEEVFGINE